MMSLVPTVVVARRTMATEDDRSDSGKRLLKAKNQVKAETINVKKPKRRPDYRDKKTAQKFVFLAPESDPHRFQVQRPKPVNSPTPLPQGMLKLETLSPPIVSSPGFSSSHQFAKEAFLSKRVFHLHPFRKKSSNRYFGPFIAAGGVTVGDAAEYAMCSELMASGSEKDQKKAIQHAISKVSAPKRVPWLRMWHEQVRVGDFIVLRHNAHTKGCCPHTPSRLFDDETGQYIGAVYVLGVVTALPSAAGDCVEEIREKVLQNSIWRGWEEEGHICSTFCPVKFLRMGFKASLKTETKERMMLCTMGEMALVCGKLDEDAAQSILLDLWDNATIPITSKEFANSCKNFQAPELLSRIGVQYGGSLFRQQWT